uniref:Ribosomal protein L6 n=1 Tax=Chlorella vulgaris TaxID=3077 RepID=A0A650AP61_CHLVU|nr:ribosomal protein L6 [Chlorella vulgaris]QGN75006.1 ribosomal protein L6 [Chlorella vulgaris]USG56565.1 ribosomal protein L6 [Chlorella vulgaris]
MKSKIYHYMFQLPETVIVEKKDHVLHFYGPLGKNYINLNKADPRGLGAISLNSEKNQLELLSSCKSFFGLFQKLIENKIKGVTRGFLIYLKIVGIGYRASLNQNTLLLKLGYSHDLIYTIPSSIKVFLLDSTLICLFGLDKNQTTQIAAKIRNLRRPSAYKGKGIRLVNEKVLVKQGKKK